MNIKTSDIVDIRHRLWRVDSIDPEILTATNIDSGESIRKKFYLPLESVKKAHILQPPSTSIGDSTTNRLLIQSYRYSILHGSAPLLSLQRSCVIPTHYQLVPVIMALNESEPIAKPDFAYLEDERSVLVFVDGPDHDNESVKIDDKNKRSRLDFLGYNVFVIRYDEDLNERVFELEELIIT